MRHRVGEGPLQHHFGRDPLELSSRLQVPREIFDDTMKVFNRRAELGVDPRLVAASDEVRPRLPQHTVHMADQFMRGAGLVPCFEVSKALRCVAQRLLGAVRKCRKEMPQHDSLLIHETFSFSFHR